MWYNKTNRGVLNKVEKLGHMLMEKTELKLYLKDRLIQLGFHNMNKESSLELSFYMVMSKVVCTNKRN